MPVDLSGQLTCGGIVLAGRVLNLSSGGMLFRADDPKNKLAENGVATIDAERIGRVTGNVLARSGADIHIEFRDLPVDALERVGNCLQSIKDQDRKFIDAAIAAAAGITKAFENALANGTTTTEALFDTNYQIIPGTNPTQYRSASIDLCDRVFPSIQEPVLDLDPRIVFCAAVDRKSFLPMHNKKFSHPQRPNDPAWNTANSRNRRIFNDKAGLRAARTVQDHLFQCYDRDMGNGTVVALKEIDAPITVQGRHWGALTLAYRA